MATAEMKLAPRFWQSFVRSQDDKIPAMGTRKNSSGRRILVIFPGALGDLVCALPAIEAIARANEGASIELMARAELARFAVGRTIVTRADSIDRAEVGALFSKSRDAIAAASEFFGAFDAVHSFFAFDDADFRAGLRSAIRGEVRFHPFRPDGDGHIAAAYLRSVGDAAKLPLPRIEPTLDDIAAARDALGLDADMITSDLVAIFPGSGSPKKNWPAEKFTELARVLSKSARVAIVLGLAEESLESHFAALSGAPSISIHRNLSLGTVAGIARVAAAFIGNDSGVSHLAAAIGTPGVAIFGPTDPARWRPLGRITVLRSDPIASISVAQVASEAASLIARQRVEASRIDCEKGVA